MKTRFNFTTIVLLTMFAFFGAPPPAEASELVVCAITTDGTSKTTASPTTGTCSWQKGATVLMTCTADVYMDSSTVANVAPTASSADQPIVFSTNQDPYKIYLDSNDQVIAVTQVTAAGSCKFMKIATRRPR